VVSMRKKEKEKRSRQKKSLLIGSKTNKMKELEKEGKIVKK